MRDFAKATGQLAKTDSIDATILALFGQRVRPELRELPDEDTQALERLSGGREDRLTHLELLPPRTGGPTPKRMTVLPGPAAVDADESETETDEGGTRRRPGPAPQPA